MIANGLWDDGWCEDQHDFICEIKYDDLLDLHYEHLLMQRTEMFFFSSVFIINFIVKFYCKIFDIFNIVFDMFLNLC